MFDMHGEKKRANENLSILKSLYPDPHHYLRFENPFQLLVATILSAQCTDDKVNAVTEGLFRRYTKPEDLAVEKLERIEEAVRSTGFYRNKAKAIKAASAEIAERFASKVPDTMDDLLSLPGIARKSANAILQHAFSRVQGIVVDTHVIRVAGRLGWTAGRNPAEIEQDLMKLFDGREWKWIPFYLKNHGRAVCRAPSPKCSECGLNQACPSAFVEPPKRGGAIRSRKGR